MAIVLDWLETSDIKIILINLIILKISWLNFGVLFRAIRSIL